MEIDHKNTAAQPDFEEENGFGDDDNVEVETLEFNNQIDFEKATIENV